METVCVLCEKEREFLFVSQTDFMLRRLKDHAYIQIFMLAFADIRVILPVHQV